MLSVDLMSLWNAVCSVHLCSSVRKRTLENCRREFFLSQRTFFSLTERTEFTEVFGAHFEPTEGLRHTEFTEAFQLTLAVTLCDIGWLNVSVGLWVFCPFVFSVRKNMSFSLCHYVILSSKNICFSSSLCYSVLQKSPVSLRPSVILSSRPPLLSLLSSCYSVFKITLSTFVFRSLCRPSEDTELR